MSIDQTANAAASRLASAVRENPESAARAVAATRAALGVTGVLAPRVALWLLAQEEARDGASRALVRSTAGRDLALGVGGLLAARRGPEALRGWIEAGALADGVDAYALTWGSGLRPAARVLGGALASAAAGVGGYLARQLTD